MMKTGKQIILLSLIAFVLHVIWENAQAPLFQGYSSFFQHLPICLLGVLGDIVITLFVFILIVLLKNDFNWMAKLNRKDIVTLAIIGFFIAVGIEWHALLSYKWMYADAMPIIPDLKIGLTPVLQMTILLPLSFYFVKLLNKKSYAET